ncbi:MAG: iron-siderophore ABC transporter substrate-binding protein [Alphaproteobacteria bacterium]|nr:iron-siderophore ABC transporter substrate-binding protein [Alphaproteobacteria bacterium]
MVFKKIITTFMVAAVSAASSVTASASDFPQTFEHRYGTTVIEQKPLRVVSLSYSGHDNLLALGVKPVAVRYWYGDYPYSVWPWAQEALGDHQPAILKGELNIEQIASLAPDLIIGVTSGVTQEQYELLSAIAPTVMSQAKYTDYSTPWQLRATTAGRAVGESEKAAILVGAIEKQIADIVKAHPNWQGKTASVSFFYNGTPGGYRSIDTRPQLLKRLGFDTPKLLDAAAAEGEFYANISPEDLTPLEADVLIWMATGDALAGLKEMPLRKKMRAHIEGREVLADNLLAGAFSFSNTLSLSYALEKLVPQIELAIDGDPSTIVPSTQKFGLLD